MTKSATVYKVTTTKTGNLTGTQRTYTQTGTLEELIDSFSYTLEVGDAYAHEKGSKKVNRNPKTIKQFIKSVENAEYNAQSSKGVTSTHLTYSIIS